MFLQAEALTDICGEDSERGYTLTDGPPNSDREGKGERQTDMEEVVSDGVTRERESSTNFLEDDRTFGAVWTPHRSILTLLLMISERK